MKELKGTTESVELIKLAMQCMGVAVTIIDRQGVLLYYNKEAGRILDRKPEYMGEDIHLHHKKTDSNNKLDSMLQDFQKGRTKPFYFGVKPYGKTILVILSPILKNGQFIGCIQSVLLKEDIESASLPI